MGQYTPQVNLVSRTGAGVVGGVAGGVLLGLVLTILGAIRPYAGIAGDTTLSTAWVMVLVVGGALGGVFGAFLGRFIRGQIVPAIGVGLVWGMITWLVLGMLVLPIVDGTRIFGMGDTGIFVLAAYVMFGVATSVVYAIAGPRRRYYTRRRRYNRDVGFVMAMPTFRRRGRGRSRRRSRSSSRDDD